MGHLFQAQSSPFEALWWNEKNVNSARYILSPQCFVTICAARLLLLRLFFVVICEGKRVYLLEAGK